jgi:uncharacterized membrane protein YkvA (DUF1232 family)
MALPGLNLGKQRQSKPFNAIPEGNAMFARLFLLFRSGGRELATLWFACRHHATPPVVKVGAVLLALYVLSPIDLITDFLPVIGWLDDVALIAMAVPALLKLVPPAVLDEARIRSQRGLSLWRG